MINITFVITNLATGGAETMLLKLLQHIDRNRFRPSVISLMGLGEIGPSIQALGVPVHVLGMPRGAFNVSRFLVLVRLLRQLKPDVVHSWMYHADLVGGVAARLAGCNCVIWGIRHSNLSKDKNKRSTLHVVKICALLSKRVPTRILSCSHRARSIHASVGYDDSKMVVIPNGFDLQRFAPDAEARSSLRRELGLVADAPLIGLIGRYDPQKNHAGFIEAAARVCAAFPQIQFVLAGAGVDRANHELNAAISLRGLQLKMHLLGRREDMPRLMAGIDLLASSSHGEGFPNVLGEAMASGVPCVVTDVGDSAEIVGCTGRVVAAGDMAGLAECLLELLRMPPEDRAALGALARARVEDQYEISRVVDAYQNFYVQVTAEQNHGI